MSNNFAVLTAVYDASTKVTPATEQFGWDPPVFVTGSCNGFVIRIYFWWSAIQDAFAFGGTAAVQALFAPVFLGIFLVTKGLSTGFPPPPKFPPAEHPPLPLQNQPGDFEQVETTCVQAMVGSWTA